MRYNYLILVIAALVFLSMPVSAQQIFQQSEPIDIRHTVTLNGSISGVNSVNITLKDPNNNLVLANQEMSFNSLGSNEWNYTLDPTKTNALGRYTYTLYASTTQGNKAQSFDFIVTPSGDYGDSNIAFFIFSIILLYSITLIGFFGRNIPITILGGMSLMFLGVYLINNGLIIYRDGLTNYIGYITIVFGSITAFWAILEQFEVI